MGNKNILQNENYENIDLIKLFNLSLRNKKIIGLFGIGFFLLACFYSLTQKRLWQGQFQIVLDKEKSSKFNNILGGLSGFSQSFGLNNSFNNDIYIY